VFEYDQSQHLQSAQFIDISKDSFSESRKAVNMLIKLELCKLCTSVDVFGWY